jgi:threonine dehydratase
VIGLDDVRAARERIAGLAIRTPLVRLDVEDAPAEIYLKLEMLQPIGSFKVRGAANLIESTPAEELADGVWTASAGNMAQGAAWCARRLGIPCTVVVPETIPAAKRDAIARLGAAIVEVPVAEWFEVFRTRTHEGMKGIFLHAFADRQVMAGNGTIALEIVEDLPDVDTVVAPFGGGGLSCGIAAALRELRPETKVYASEVATGAPLAPSLAAGKPLEVEHTHSFVDGIGAPSVLPEMFELAEELLAGSLVVGLEEIAAAVRLLAERGRIVAEGAGATPVAAALKQAGGEKVVAVVSGGNIDASKLATILRGGVP